MVTFKSFFVGTTKGVDLINIGHDVRGFIREAKLENGSVTVSFRQSGAALALLPNDGKGSAEVQQGLESIPPALRHLLPPSLALPVERGKLFFEPWQELFLIDFEPSARRREVVVQLFSEGEKGVKS